jgi:hypothetical protein
LCDAITVSLAHGAAQLSNGPSVWGTAFALATIVLSAGAAWVAADVVRIEDGRLAEHWDVLQDEATEAESKSGQPMFGGRFPG